MTNEYVPHFEIGETAVLKTQIGGRLFEIGKLPDEIIPGEHYMVSESMQHGTRWHEVSTAWLIKVKSRDEALQLVAILCFIQEAHQRKVSALEQERSKMWSNAIANYSIAGS